MGYANVDQKSSSKEMVNSYLFKEYFVLMLTSHIPITDGKDLSTLLNDAG